MEIEKVMIPIEKIINNSEECFAHVAKDNKQKETLKEHTERCQKYWKNLVEKKNLTEILEEFEKCYFNSTDEKVKEIFESMTVNIVTMHDIGKVRELSCSSIMSIDYTPDGNLLGHLFIGAEMVGKCARKLGLSEEKTLLLQHMLLSHHGKREMGAVTLPAIPEASILHHVDCMDAEMYMFRLAREETKPGEMSDRLFALDCRVYNPKN